MGKLDQKKQENVIYWSIDQCKKAHLAYFRDTKAWFRLNISFGEYLKPGFVSLKYAKCAFLHWSMLKSTFGIF